MKDDVLSLPFDQYQRYRLVADLVRQVERDGRKRTILDVGGRTGVLRKFLPDHAVTLVDVEPSDIPDVVIGDGRKLPFKAKSFDIVAAFDTLEHVPKSGRDAFVDECARVAKEHVVLVGPYAHPAVDEAEELLLRFLEDWLGEKHRYLREHRANTLPSMEATLKRLAKRGANTAVIAHGNVERWLGLMCLSLYMDHEPHLRPLAARMHRFWNEALHESDTGEPAYRHAVVASFVGEPPRVVYEAKADALPAKVLAGARVLSTKLVEFEAARRDWRDERKRLEETARTLKQDLAGHKKSLKESLRKEAQALDVVETLRADLAGHAASLQESTLLLERQRAAADGQKAELEADLARHKEVVSEREARLAEHEEVERELRDDLLQTRGALTTAEADLDGHRAALAALRGEETALRAAAQDLGREIAALQEHAGELEHALMEHKLVVADREKQLDEWRQVAAERDALLAAEGVARHELEADLEGHRKLLAELRTDLEGHRGLADALRAQVAQVEDELRAAGASLESGKAAAEALRHEVLRERALVADREREARQLQDQIAAHLVVQSDLGARIDELVLEIGRREELERTTRAEFDAVRDELEAELARRREAQETVEADLAGHRTLVADLKSALKLVEDDLRAAGGTLEEERARSEALRHESRREAARADLRESELSAAREQLAAHERVQSDLAASIAAASEELERREELARTTRAEFDAVRDELEAELARRREAQETVEADLAGHRTLVADLRAALLRVEDDLRAAGATIEAERAQAEALRHEARREAARADLRESELSASRGELLAHERVQSQLNERIAELDAELARRETLALEALAAHDAVRAAIQSDLDGHKQALAAVELDLQGHKALVADLRAATKSLEDRLRDEGKALAAERAKAEALRHELAAERLVVAETARKTAALEQQLEEHRAAVRDLEADLAGHRGALRDARAELDLRRARIAELEAAWNASEEQRAATQSELERERALRADLEAQVARAREIIAAQDAKIGELRALLARRWASLKRALWLKQPLP